MDTLANKIDTAIWVAKSLFDRNKASGSSANISIRHKDCIWISASGTCFGRLTPNDFAQVSMEGQSLDHKHPSKEFPLHQMLYQSHNIGAVVHTHSTYATLWSCLQHQNPQDCVPTYTPYLKMKLGAVDTVPYASPGSEVLFDLFRQQVAHGQGFLLANHGPIVGGKDILDAFYRLEELEESCKLAWLLGDKKAFTL